MIGALVSAGATLLGGLLGRKKQEKTVTESTVDYQKMASSAAAAGFNPLTAIRNGGSAGFTTSTTTSPTASSLPGALQSIGGVLGDALENQFDPLARKKRQLDTALVDYQLRQLKEGPRAVPGTLYSGGNTYGVKVSRPPRLVQKYSDDQRMSYGPQLPAGAGDNGKILPAVTAWRRSDGSLMYTYNPQFPDGDAVIAGGALDMLGRGVEAGEQASRSVRGFIRGVTSSGSAAPVRKDLRLPSGYRSGRW